MLSPEELAVAAAYYDIGTAGEMQHNPSKNVLYVAVPLDRIASRLGVPLDQATRRLASATEALRAARGRRTAPAVDRSRYTNWNGMLASALLRAGVVLGDDWARDHALRTLDRIRGEQEDPASLRHSPGGIGGLLDDQVQVAQAALDAHEATGDAGWLDWAIALLERVQTGFRDRGGGGLLDVAVDRRGEGLLPTPAKPVQDAPTPSPNGVATLCYARLAARTGERRWAAQRDELARAFAGRARELGLHGATILLGLDWAVNPATHIVIVPGEEPGGQKAVEGMRRTALSAFVPRRVVQVVGDRDGGMSGLPGVLRGMLTAGGGTRAYLCQGTSCRAPIFNEAELATALASPPEAVD